MEKNSFMAIYVACLLIQQVLVVLAVDNDDSTPDETTQKRARANFQEAQENPNCKCEENVCKCVRRKYKYPEDMENDADHYKVYRMSSSRRRKIKKVQKRPLVNERDSNSPDNRDNAAPYPQPPQIPDTQETSSTSQPPPVPPIPQLFPTPAATVAPIIPRNNYYYNGYSQQYPNVQQNPYQQYNPYYQLPQNYGTNVVRSGPTTTYYNRNGLTQITSSSSNGGMFPGAQVASSSAGGGTAFASAGAGIPYSNMFHPRNSLLFPYGRGR